MDISKAIDKEFGKLEERKVVDTKKWIQGGGTSYMIRQGEKREVEQLITKPATLEAKKWQGWGTALKPACEPIVLARKPISEKNVAQNVLKWGTGGLNIDGCRIPYRDEKDRENARKLGESFAGKSYNTGIYQMNVDYSFTRTFYEPKEGRFPANVILDEEAAKMLDEQTGDLGVSRGGNIGVRKNKIYGQYGESIKGDPGYGDSGGASRFFYCAKTNRDERFAYCYTCNEVIPQNEWTNHKSHEVEFHPTIKPLKLIEYLVRLITPPNSIVLDPFFGTGTTGIAAFKQGFRFTGIEISESYVKIAEHRLKPYLAQQRLTEFEVVEELMYNG
jgi:site-specific DNA-methyltransferase (adenine-specific)